MMFIPLTHYLTKLRMLLYILGFSSSVLAQQTYFVTTEGDDTNPGTSPEMAFRTIRQAASIATAGDIVEVAAGIYRETVRPAASGQAGARLTFRAATGAEVIISGADPVTGWTAQAANVWTWASRANGSRPQIVIF